MMVWHSWKVCLVTYNSQAKPFWWALKPCSQVQSSSMFRKELYIPNTVASKLCLAGFCCAWVCRNGAAGAGTGMLCARCEDAGGLKLRRELQISALGGLQTTWALCPVGSKGMRGWLLETTSAGHGFLLFFISASICAHVTRIPILWVAQLLGVYELLRPQLHSFI